MTPDPDPGPDPRPCVVVEPDGARVVGWRCTACGWAVALPGPCCPRCRGGLAGESFGPGGVVWSCTVLRVPLPGRPLPRVLAYVDLDDGPRVLAHLAAAVPARIPVGSRVRITGTGADGDLLVTGEGTS